MKPDIRLNYVKTSPDTDEVCFEICYWQDANIDGGKMHNCVQTLKPLPNTLLHQIASEKPNGNAKIITTGRYGHLWHNVSTIVITTGMYGQLWENVNPIINTTGRCGQVWHNGSTTINTTGSYGQLWHNWNTISNTTGRYGQLWHIVSTIPNSTGRYC